ncbi:MAG: hypothetical protein WC365_00835 [Candidatus Babeliales bacterium]
MTKGELVKTAVKMLYQLGREEEQDGFNEFPQFCEDYLRESIPKMTSVQLHELIKEIKTTSVIGIKSP